MTGYQATTGVLFFAVFFIRAYQKRVSPLPLFFGAWALFTTGQ